MKRLKRWLLVTAMLAGGVVLMFDGWGELQDCRKLAREGEKTVGTVVDNSATHRRKRGTTYRLEVEFAPGGQGAMQQWFTVGSGVYYKAVEAGKVTVHYLTSNPTICDVGDTVRTRYGGLLVGFGLFIGGLGIHWYFRFVGRQISTLCVTERQYAAVDARDFKHLDLAFYEEAQAVLETHGYHFLGDREDLTFRKSSGLRIPLRVLVSGDGATIAGIYHFRPAWIWRCLGAKSARVLDLETKYANGEWLITTNAEEAGKLDSPPGVDSISLTAETCVETVIESHAHRLASYANRHPGVEPVRLTTIEDVEREFAALTKLKAEHRRKTGLTKQELQRLGGTGPSAELNILHDGISAEHRKKHGKAA